jgi:hypothetical protein
MPNTFSSIAARRNQAAAVAELQDSLFQVVIKCGYSLSLGAVSLSIALLYQCEGTPKINLFLLVMGGVLIFYTVCRVLHFYYLGKVHLGAYEWIFMVFNWVFCIFGAFWYKQQDDLYAVNDYLEKYPQLVDPERLQRQCALDTSRMELILVVFGFVHFVVFIYDKVLWAKSILDAASIATSTTPPPANTNSDRQAASGNNDNLATTVVPAVNNAVLAQTIEIPMGQSHSRNPSRSFRASAQNRV